MRRCLPRQHRGFCMACLSRPDGFSGVQAPFSQAAPKPFFVALRAPLLVPALCLLLCSAGCAAKNTGPTAWDLGTEGEVIYSYLLLEDAAATGDAEAFKTALDKLLAIDPDVRVFREAADFSLRRRNFAEARTTARQGLERYPSDLGLTLLLADSYIQEKRNNDAVDTMAQYVKAHPNNPDATQEFARLLLIVRRYAALETLVRQMPERHVTPYIHYAHGKALLELGRPAEAERFLRRAMKEDPDIFEALPDLALALYKQGKSREAAALYRQAIEADPESLSLRLGLVEVHLKSKRPDLALKVVTEAPESTPFQLEAATLFMESRNNAGAKAILQKLQGKPELPDEVYFYMAALAIDENNTKEALEQLARVPSTSRLAERALRWRLQILVDEKRNAEALGLALQTLKDNPELSTYHILAAQTAAQTGNLEQSETLLRAAAAHWPENGDIAYQLGGLLDERGKKEEALAVMEALLARDPNNTQAQNYIGYTLTEQRRDLDRAFALISRAAAAAPDSPHIVDSLAWVYYQRGQYQEAWQAIQESIRLGADHAVIWEHYGDIAAKLGNKVEARKGYTNALKVKPENPEALRLKLKNL